MLILNTITVLGQVILIFFVSLICMNILKLFSSNLVSSKIMETKEFKIAPSIFVNHGGGPMPLLPGAESEGLTQFLKYDIKKYVNFDEIKAIILVTAHWEEDKVTISSGKHHDLYFDYYGFPPETYKYKYNAPGNPDLAHKIFQKLTGLGIKAALDSKRGWDHGVFVPMMLINPAANIPIVQISVLKNQDLEKHWEYGRALYEFRKEGIAVIGSGMSYHNMREFMTRNEKQKGVVNEPFDDFLNVACLKDEMDRKSAFLKWRNQKGSDEAHPPYQAEHFMPLIVTAAAGGPDEGKRIFNWDYSSKFRLSAFVWNHYYASIKTQ